MKYYPYISVKLTYKVCKCHNFFIYLFLFLQVISSKSFQYYIQLVLLQL